MTTQEFAVMDVLRLQVQEGWPDLPNLVANPSGDGGAWGWTGNELTSTGTSLLFTAVTPDWCGFTVDVPEVTAAGMQVRAAVTRVAASSSVNLFVRVLAFGDSTIVPLAIFSEALSANGAFEIDPSNIPVGTKSLQFKIDVGSLGDTVEFKDAVMMFGLAADVAASDPLTEPDWIDVLGSAAEIVVERDELNVGTLEATLYDATLDPASTDLIRPGKRVRLETLIGSQWEPVFRGKLENPSSAYEVRDPNRSDLRRVKIKLVGSDAVADLANDPRPNGVATIPELPYVLLGTEVPWNINGSTDAIDPDSVVIVSVNDQAKAIDQVAITRDSVLGYAWVDRGGTLQAWDRAELGAVVTRELDETSYSDVDIDFDVERTFNTVTIKLLQINPGTGETEELTFGPYIAPDARREWRTRTAEFTVQGVDPDLIDDLAAEILALNAVPVKRINSVTLPLRTLDELAAGAMLDLYDLVSLSNDRADVEDQQSRITSVKHRITIKRQGAILTNRWWVDLGFSTEGSVAAPQVTPSPTVGGGKTIGQLLEPIGKVSMWYGLAAECPTGWLVMDGSAYDTGQYPALHAHLEALETAGLHPDATVLPNMEDRFPIGAGVKALGSSGGSVTTDPPAAGNSWAVDDTGGQNAVRLGSYDAHTHDVIPPWRALWFIIRAA